MHNLIGTVNLNGAYHSLSDRVAPEMDLPAFRQPSKSDVKFLFRYYGLVEDTLNSIRTALELPQLG